MAVEDPFKGFLEGEVDPPIIPADEKPSEPSEAAPAEDDTPKDEPDYKAMLDKEVQERQELQRKFEEKERDFESRYSQLERLVGQGYQQARPQEPEIAITQDDMLDPRALEAKTDALMQRKLAAYNERVGQVMATVVERGFKGELAGLSAREYFPQLREQLEHYFEQNPAEKMAPGRVESKYNELVGANLNALREAEPDPEPVQKPRPAPPSSVLKPVPPANEPDAPKGPQLNSLQKSIQEKFAMAGVEVTDDEQADIGKTFPKGRAI